MFKALFVILSVFALLSQGAMFRIASDNELRVNQNGQVTLTYVPGAGYTVPVDFAKHAPFSKNMILSLYSSNTLLTKSCFNFDSYMCAQYACTKDPRTFSVNYPHFTAQGNLATTNVHLDYSAWSLNRGAPAMIANACSAPLTERFGAQTQGILGLGFDGLARSNFQSLVHTFSVFFNQQFRLQFNPSINFNKNLIAQVRTDANWKIPTVAALGLGSLTNPLTGVSAIFDINSDSIGLPQPVYQTLVGAMGQFGVNCPQGVWTQPTCQYAGNPSFLPPIKVFIDQATSILITPQMYALNPANGQIKLNFRALSPQLTGINYVTPDYQYTMILGNTVLGGYYTYFNLNDRSVSLYQVL